jgi:hypothetical protein
VKEFRKLTPEAKGEMLTYTKWMRDIEAKERVRELKKSNLKRDAYGKAGTASTFSS